MKEPLLEVLIYLFDQYAGNEFDRKDYPDKITPEMSTSGFHPEELEQALRWLDDLNHLMGNFENISRISGQSVHIYSKEEWRRFTQRSISYLLCLEQSGIVDPVSRELIIDRSMALEEPKIDVHEIQWVGLLVLSSEYEKKQQLLRMEDLVFHGYSEWKH